MLAGCLGDGGPVGGVSGSVGFPALLRSSRPAMR